MKFFLVALFFIPLALPAQTLAPDITSIMPSRGDVWENIESLPEAYKRAMRDTGVAHAMEDMEEEYMSQQRARAVRYVVEDTEEYMSQRAQAVRYVVEDTERTLADRIQSERDNMEYISRAAKLQEYMSGLISRSDGELCGLSQDPVQCCNTFAPSPGQCLHEVIEKGTADISVLKEGVCSVAQNMEGCASQVSSAVLLQLMSEQPSTIYQFPVPEGSFSEPDIFAGEEAPVFSTVMDHPGESFPAPEIQNVEEALNGPTTLEAEVLRRLYKGVKTPSVPGMCEGLPVQTQQECKEALASITQPVRFTVPWICSQDPASSECAEILRKMTRQSHNFSATADAFTGENRGTSVPTVMDYPSMQLHEFAKTIGLQH